MESALTTLFELTTFYIRFLIFEVLSVLTFIGLLILLCGTFMLSIFYLVKTNGYVTEGKLLGLATKTRIKTKKSGVQEEKVDRRLAFEYTDDQGNLKRGLTSEWHNKYKKIATHQLIPVKVITHKLYDDIYLANELGSFYAGIISIALGLTLFVKFFSYPAFWISTSIILTTLWLLSNWFLSNSKPDYLPEDKVFATYDIKSMEESLR